MGPSYVQGHIPTGGSHRACSERVPSRRGAREGGGLQEAALLAVTASPAAWRCWPSGGFPGWLVFFRGESGYPCPRLVFTGARCSCRKKWKWDAASATVCLVPLVPGNLRLGVYFVFKFVHLWAPRDWDVDHRACTHNHGGCRQTAGDGCRAGEGRGGEGERERDREPAATSLDARAAALTCNSQFQAASRRPVALGQVDERWAGPWGWFANEAASTHMMSEGANEKYAPLGSFRFDQGAIPWNTHRR